MPKHIWWIKNQQIDTSTISGMLFYSILTSLSNYELELTRERIKSGLENCRRKGIQLGRKSNLTISIKNKILKMKSKNIGWKKICKECKIGRKTYDKVLQEPLMV